MFESKLNDLEQPVTNEILVQLSSCICLQAFSNRTTLLNKKHCVLFPGEVLLLGSKDTEELLEKLTIGLQMLNDVDLVKEDEGVENRKGGVVQNTGQDDILQVLQAISVVDLSFYAFIFDLYYFLEFGLVRQVLPMVRLVQWEVWIICKMSERILCVGLI